MNFSTKTVKIKENKYDRKMVLGYSIFKVKTKLEVQAFYNFIKEFATFDMNN